MKNKLTTIRTAPAAIAAVLALSSTPLFAQDAVAPAVPVIVLPEVATPEPSAPTVSIPVVQAVPVVAVPEPEPVAARVQPRRAPVAVVRAVPAPATVEELAAAPIAVLPAAPVEAPAPIAVAEPAPFPAPVPSADPSMTGPLLGGLGVLGLGLLALAALRRRKRDASEPGEIAIVDKPRVGDLPVIAAQAPAEMPRAASFVRPNGRVALPQHAPATYEERSALLRRMVEARPDRANPFVSRKARAKRARLILQSLGHDFADRDPLIDLGDYPQNWPLVARRRYAAAA